MSFSMNGIGIKPVENMLITNFRKEFRNEMDNTWGQSSLTKATIIIQKANVSSVINSNFASHSELIFAKIREAQISILKNSHNSKLNSHQTRKIETLQKLYTFIEENKLNIALLNPEDLTNADFQTEWLFRVVLENLESKKLESSENPVFEAITDL